MNKIKLSNDSSIPQIGLGTWQVTDKELMRELLDHAYQTGYRLIDTAAAYSNEMAIGRAVTGLSIERRELFLSDKVWNTSRGYDNVRKACEKSLKKLKTDYLDLYLIHWPASPRLYSGWAEINADTWRGMESLYKEGMVRAIGVCNFKAHHLEELKKTAEIMPMVNQLEFHPGMMQEDTVSFCRAEGIVLEASSPLGNGQILENEILRQIAQKKGRTAAQICLRWAVQKGLAVIPKTVNPDRLKENMDIFGFELSEEETDAIDKIPYCGGIGIDSDEVVEFG